MTRTIYISPENRAKPYGAYAGFDTYEEKECRKIGELLAKELENNGFASVIAKDSSPIAQRVDDANIMKADIYITLHSNSSVDHTAFGPEVWYFNNPSTKRACQLVYDELMKLYPRKGRGLKDGSKAYYEIRNTKMVSIYPELAFHDYQPDAEWVVNNKTKIAQAICKGICAYFGVVYTQMLTKPVAPEQEKPADTNQPNIEDPNLPDYKGFAMEVIELANKFNIVL